MEHLYVQNLSEGTSHRRLPRSNAAHNRNSFHLNIMHVPELTMARVRGSLTTAFSAKLRCAQGVSGAFGLRSRPARVRTEAHGWPDSRVPLRDLVS
ncbi:MAG TPA: hypothetical protein VNG12_13910 [Acidimicrobiales bacterium]|nr:hypothetical protein [Acidimicrobiales bacterium]